MPTLSVLWKIRKETFTYEKGERFNASVVFLMLLSTSFSCFTAATMAITIFSENSGQEVFFACTLLSVSTLAFVLTYGAYYVKVIVSADEEYVSDSIIMSQLQKIRKPLAILGLTTLFKSYGLSINMIDKKGNDVVKTMRINFFTYKWSLRLKGTRKYNPEMSMALNPIYEDGFSIRDISSHKSNPFSSIRFFIIGKAFKFLFFKMFNNGRDLSGYGSLILRGVTLKSLQACTRLNLTSEKAEYLISQNIPISDYELVKDLPVAWIAKIYNKSDAAVDNQFVVC
jgi:hypothetical protein